MTAEAKTMIVTFCGHRDFVKTDTTEQILTALLERYAQENDELICYCGGCGNFDGFAAECLRQLKERYQNIRSYLILPYINPEYLERLGVIKKFYDDTIYPPLENVPKKYAIIRRNEWIVDNADVVIACVKYSWGGAAKTSQYAKRKKKAIEYLPTFSR